MRPRLPGRGRRSVAPAASVTAEAHAARIPRACNGALERWRDGHPGPPRRRACSPHAPTPGSSPHRSSSSSSTRAGRPGRRPSPTCSRAGSSAPTPCSSSRRSARAVPPARRRRTGLRSGASFRACRRPRSGRCCGTSSSMPGASNGRAALLRGRRPPARGGRCRAGGPPAICGCRASARRTPPRPPTPGARLTPGELAALAASDDCRALLTEEPPPAAVVAERSRRSPRLPVTASGDAAERARAFAESGRRRLRATGRGGRLPTSAAGGAAGARARLSACARTKRRLPEFRTLACVLGQGIYLGDNLELLARLPDESFVLVYIDPPFNTGTTQRRLTLSTSRDPARRPHRLRR